MSSDKLPSALSIPNKHQSSPRGLSGSILNGNKESQPVLPNPTSQGSTQSYQTNNYTYGNENTGYMNSQPNSSYGALDYGHQHHLSQGQPPTPQTATSGGSLSSFPPQPPILQPHYPQPSTGVFPQFQFPPNGVSSPAGQPGVSGPMSVHPAQQLLPLPQTPSMAGSHSALSSVSGGGPQTPASATAGTYSSHSFDTTGQLAPPGMKPRVAATLWEDEGSLCFQVEARGVCVARREDNHMINGTKLLNVAGMTRGRRDGILKSEKVRHVVKIGPMHLKGVWIPFERALDFANKEKITELLYPLFVHNIGAFLYHPTNSQRTNAVMAAAERRRADSNVLSQSQALNQGALQRRGPSDLIPSSQPPPLHANMHSSLHTTLPPHPNLTQPNRPELQRSMTFPTPPSSASSVIGVGGSDGSSFWNGNMVPSVGGTGNQSLAIDTVINTHRSLPNTPATTPPGGLQQLQQYPPNSIYQGQSGNMSQQNVQRYPQSLPQPSQYISQPRDSSNMGPPPPQRGPASLSRPSSRQGDAHVKEDGEEQNGIVGEHEDHGVQEVHGGEEHQDSGEHVQEVDYTTHDGSYTTQGNHRSYYPPLNSEHPSHLPSEMTDSSSHGQGPSTPARSTYGAPNVGVPRTVENGSGATPRTTTTPQGQWTSEFSTPPRSNSSNGAPSRAQPQSRNIYELVSGDPANDASGPNGAGAEYGSQPGLGVSMQSQTPPQPYGNVNGTTGSGKRLREMDDDGDQASRPPSSGHDDRGDGDVGGLKRRKTLSAPSTTMSAGGFDRNTDARINRNNRSVIGATTARARRA